MAYKSKVLTVSEGGTGASTLTGVLSGNGTGAITASAITQHNVLTAGASNAISSVAPGSSGNVLKSDGTDWTSGTVTGSLGPYLRMINNAVGNPSPSQTVFINGGPGVGVTTSGACTTRMYVTSAATLTKCYGTFTVQGTLASTQSCTLAIRLNNTTDTTVTSSLQLSAADNTFSNTGLSISVSPGDFLEFKFTSGAWSPSPTNVAFSGIIE